MGQGLGGSSPTWMYPQTLHFHLFIGRPPWDGDSLSLYHKREEAINLGGRNPGSPRLTL